LTAGESSVIGEIDRVEKSSTLVSDRGLDPLTLHRQIANAIENINNAAEKT
jgi:hypothetical protein